MKTSQHHPKGFASSGSLQANKRGPAAFTLIELMVVITIIAILAGLTLGSMGYVNRKSAEARARTEVAALSAAIDSFKLEYGKYPENEDTLYAELTGTGTINTNKVFFEPTPGMVTNNDFIDPWGTPYRYIPNPTNADSVNIGFFDLYSEGGGKNKTNYIRN